EGAFERGTVGVAEDGELGVLAVTHPLDQSLVPRRLGALAGAGEVDDQARGHHAEPAFEGAAALVLGDAGGGAGCGHEQAIEDELEELLGGDAEVRGAPDRAVEGGAVQALEAAQGGGVASGAGAGEVEV